MGTGGSSWNSAEDSEMGLLWNSDMTDYVRKVKSRLIGAHFLCAWEASRRELMLKEEPCIMNLTNHRDSFMKGLMSGYSMFPFRLGFEA